MSIQGDVRLDQDGVVPTALAYPSGAAAAALATAIVDVNGNQLAGFDVSRPENATIASVAYATGAVPILAANLARRGVILFNATNKAINISLSVSGASSGVFSFQIPTNGSWESELNGYQGAISAFWLQAPSAGATLHVTEITT